jgi:small subunit ribosomal protein S17e
MGKVRPIFIKKNSKELIEKYPNAFTKDFEKNKKTLNIYTEIQSKLVRNRIAGYITHLIKFKKKNEE